jgi:hypothetical protein
MLCSYSTSVLSQNNYSLCWDMQKSTCLKNAALQNKEHSIHTQIEFQFRNSSKGSGLDHTTMTFLLVYWTTFYVVTMFWSKITIYQRRLVFRNNSMTYDWSKRQSKITQTHFILNILQHPFQIPDCLDLKSSILHCTNAWYGCIPMLNLGQPQPHLNCMTELMWVN